MRQGRFVCISLFVCGFLVALQAPAQAISLGSAPQTGLTSLSTPLVEAPGRQPLATGSVTGHVYCADTRRPARLARVMLRAVPAAKAERRSDAIVISGFGGLNNTGLNGEFSVEHVKPGSYYVSVQMPGYVDPLNSVDSKDLNDPSPEAQMRVRQKVQMVDVGTDAARVDVTIDRGGTIGGVVKYDDGSPAANVRVMPMQVDKDGRRSGLGSTLTPTDDRGVFRISGLAPGTYTLSAAVTLPSSRPGHTMKVGDREMTMPQMRFVNIYAPSTFHRSEATPYEVGYGTERNDVEITLNFSALHTVSGQVAGADEAHRAMVMLRDMSGSNGDSFNRGGQVSKDGSFYVDDVPDGTYQVTLSGTANPVTTITVHGSDVNDLKLSATPAAGGQ